MTETHFVTDLDELLPDDKIVRLAGREWKLPGDLPMETFLRLGRLEQESEKDDADEENLLQRMVVILVDLFTMELEDGKPEDLASGKAQLSKVFGRLGVNTLPKVMRELYGVEDTEEDPPVEELDDGKTKTSLPNSETTKTPETKTEDTDS